MDRIDIHMEIKSLLRFYLRRLRRPGIIRILKIAKTIADLEGERNIKSDHMAEAIQYRSLDRRVFR